MITEEDRKACGVHLGEDGRSVVILDQTQLPNRQVYLTLRTVDEIYDAIKRLSVRGAPAIGMSMSTEESVHCWNFRGIRGCPGDE